MHRTISTRIRGTNTTACVLLLLSLSAFCLHAIEATVANETDTLDPTVVDKVEFGLESTAQGDADLLKWAIKHSNPQALASQAKDAKMARKSPADIDRRKRAAELLEVVRAMPTEAQLVEDALELLANTGANDSEKLHALHALSELVESIDVADHFLAVGGANSLVKLLGQAPVLEAAAARTLGKAASNNGPFQEALLGKHPDVMLRLVQLLSSAGDDTILAALYAAGSLARTSVHGRSLWAQAGGGDVLVHLVRGMKQASRNNRTQRRAMALAADLVQLDARSVDVPGLADALISVLQGVNRYPGSHWTIDTWELAEKALLAMEALRSSDGGRHALRRKGDVAVLRLLLQEADSKRTGEFTQDVVELAKQQLLKAIETQERNEL